MPIEPPPAAFEPEHRYRFTAQDPDGDHVMVSGTVAMSGLKGDEDETKFKKYDIQFCVGPFWRDVQSVVPHVSVSGFRNSNADQDDEQGWKINDLTWDAVSGTGPNVNEERIRLKFKIRVQGEKSLVTGVGYYLIARGRQLGDGGLAQPAPMHPNP